MNMKLIIFWDIYWRIWRKALKKELTNLKNKYNPDFIIANSDNITSWRGIIEKLIPELKCLGIDILTWWDHVFDNDKYIKDYIDKKDSILLRPANFYDTNLYKIPWVWYKIFKKNSKRLLVIHLLWEIFMRYNVYNPFLKAREIILWIDKNDYDEIVIDFHKEATAEWYWLANFLNWEISLLYGTHTHVQTNDEIILSKWTWFISDVWMVWAIDSIIWADYKSVEKRFLTWIQKWKIKQELSNKYIVNAIFTELKNWKCIKIEKIKIKDTL